MRANRIWNILIIATATFAAVKIPAQLVTEASGLKELVYLDWTITAVFIADLFLNCFMPLTQKGQRIRNRPIQAKHCLKGWFLVDLLAAIPF